MRLIFRKDKRHPPKAQLTLRVGITGHRPEGLKQLDEKLLRSQLQKTFDRIEQFASQWKEENRTLFSEDPLVLRLITSLAEGADRLAADEASEAKWELQCPLPFSIDDYEKDFISPDSKKAFRELLRDATAVVELDGSRATEETKSEAYLAAGRMMLDQCDALIAVWDGEKPRGEGGTGQIVHEALQRQIPVIWIAAESPHAACLLENPDDALSPCGETSFDETLDRLNDRICLMLQPPKPDSELDLEQKNPKPDLREIYFSKTPLRWTLGFYWPWFCDLFAFFKCRIPRVFVKNFQTATAADWDHDFPNIPDCLMGEEDSEAWKRQCREWEKRWQAAPPLPGAVEDYLQKTLRNHYCWADNLANYYADLYRSSFVVGYFFSALAVLAATLGAAMKFLGNFDNYEPIMIVVELTVMILLLSCWHWSKSYHWHDCWIDFRLLAEYLRIQRFLAPLGFMLPSTRPPGLHRQHADPQGSWVYWHFRSIVREAGLPRTRFDADYLQACRCFVWKKLILRQWHYQQNIHARYYRLHEHLHILEMILIWSVILVGAGHLAYIMMEKMHWVGEIDRYAVPLTMIVAAVCPAFSAAFYAVGVQAELERLVKRSEAMSKEFKEVAGRLSDTDAARSSQTLQRIIAPVAESMIAEHFDWRLVIQEREWTPV